MKTETTGNLSELLPLRLRVQEDLKYFREGEQIFAESSHKECDYILLPWQYEILTRMDGTRSFGALIDDIAPVLPHEFTAEDWLAFYGWLHGERLILCEADPVFEMVEETKLPKSDWKFEALKWSAIFVLVLGILRISYVIAPVFEPGMDRVYAEVENWFLPDPAGMRNSSSQKIASDSSIKEISLSGVVPNYDAIEKLRRQLAACRVRRDEYYLQNNEEGYRREVRAMGELAREIGTLDAVAR